MHVPAAVHVLHRREHLRHEVLGLADGENGLARERGLVRSAPEIAQHGDALVAVAPALKVEHVLQVVLVVLHDHVHGARVAPDHHLPHPNDVRVRERQQDVGLPQRRDWEAVLRARSGGHLHALERHELPRPALARQRHDAVGPLVDLPHALVVVHPAAAREHGVVRMGRRGRR